MMLSVGSPYLCSFFMSLALGMFWVGLPYLVKDLHNAEAWHLGLMGALSSVGYMLTCLFAGKMTGRFRRHHLMACGALIVAVVMVLVRFAGSLWAVVALMTLAGFGHGLFWPTLETYLSEGVGPSELRHRMGWFNLSWSSGDALGAFLGGGVYVLVAYLAKLTGVAGLRGSHGLLTGAIALCISALALTRLHSTPERDSRHEVRDQHVPKSPGRGGHTSLAVFWVMALVANGAAMALRGTMMNIFPDFGKDVLHYSAFRWGILMGAASLARTVMFIYWQRRHAWEYRARPLFWVQALLPLSALILIFNSNYWVFVLAFVLAGVGMSKTYFASIFYAMDSDHSHQHRGGIHEAVMGAGMMMPLVAGVIASVSGWVRSPYVFIFVLLIVGMIIQVVLYRRSRTAPRHARGGEPVESTKK